MPNRHRALLGVRDDIHHIFEDSRILTEDSLNLISDVEHLERDCKSHWKELLSDVLCFLCGKVLIEDEIRIRPTSTVTSRSATSPSISTPTRL